MTTNSDRLLTVGQINERLGFGLGYTLLWNASITDILGVKPAARNAHGHAWTEDQFIEIAKRLRDRLQQRIDFYEDEEL